MPPPANSTFLASRIVCAMMALMAIAGEDPAPPGPFVVVEGQVTDALGAGQKDVTVSVRRKPSDDAAGESIGDATTNELGDFAVTVAQPVRGDLVVTLTKPRYATIVREIHLDENGKPTYLAETLSGDQTVAGRVLDTLTQKPIGGAGVTVRVAGEDKRAASGDDGRFSVAGVAPGELELTVEATGYGRERRTLPDAEAAADVSIALKPERVVHVRVTDEAHRPIPDVIVECLDQRRSDFRQAMTDADGRVTLRGIHFDASILAVRLTHALYVSGESFDRSVTLPRDAGESAHELALLRAGRIEGRVTDAATRAPLQGARLVTGEQYSDNAPRDFSDVNGRYVIPGVRPGKVIVTIYLSGYAPELKSVEVNPGEDTTLDVALESPNLIEGVVQTDEGVPIADAELTAVAWRSSATLGLRARTDPAGRFRIENGPRDEFEVLVRAPGRESVTRTLRAQSGGVVIALPAEAPPARDPKKGVLDIGEPMPDVTVRTLDGATINLREFTGKVVLVDFWATWCLPCVEELPHLIDVYEKYSSHADFVLLGISKDFETEAARDYLKRNPKVVWPQVVGDAAGVRRACEGFGVGSLPEVFLIGPDGKVAAHKLRREKIREAVDALMNAKPGE